MREASRLLASVGLAVVHPAWKEHALRVEPWSKHTWSRREHSAQSEAKPGGAQPRSDKQLQELKNKCLCV